MFCDDVLRGITGCVMWRTPTKSYRITELVGVFSYNIAMVSEQRPTKVSKYCTLVGLFLQISYNEVAY